VRKEYFNSTKKEPSSACRMKVFCVLFGFLAFYYYQRNQRLAAGLFFALAIIFFFKINIFGLIIAILFIYFGYRMLKKNEEDNRERVQNDTVFQTEEANVKKSFIGEVYYTERFELKDFSIQQAIGDVKIDSFMKVKRSLLSTAGLEASIFMYRMIFPSLLMLLYSLESLKSLINMKLE